jgi:hypothetical protein
VADRGPQFRIIQLHPHPTPDQVIPQDRMRNWRTKHILPWDTRLTAERMFAVRVKDDILKHERIQKSKMWPIMNAMYEAELRPSWLGVAITWKFDDKWFIIHPGELFHDSLPSHIVKYAKYLCGVEHSPPAQAISLDAPHNVREAHVEPSPKLSPVERNLCNKMWLWPNAGLLKGQSNDVC